MKKLVIQNLKIRFENTICRGCGKSNDFNFLDEAKGLLCLNCLERLYKIKPVDVEQSFNHLKQKNNVIKLQKEECSIQLKQKNNVINKQKNNVIKLQKECSILKQKNNAINKLQEECSIQLKQKNNAINKFQEECSILKNERYQLEQSLKKTYKIKVFILLIIVIGSHVIGYPIYMFLCSTYDNFFKNIQILIIIVLLELIGLFVYPLYKIVKQKVFHDYHIKNFRIL